jgi:TRAP-type mannitol/chloroaromatic compound transport system permease small subunit
MKGHWNNRVQVSLINLLELDFFLIINLTYLIICYSQNTIRLKKTSHDKYMDDICQLFIIIHVIINFTTLHLDGIHEIRHPPNTPFFHTTLKFHIL